jgi:ubiquinone/menaquinone biosynthesis C-methylase UbiE
VKENSHDRSRIYQVNLDSRDENDARIVASKYVTPRSVVLDVGSACGDFGVLLHKQKDCEVHGMEFSKASIEIAKNTHAYSVIHQVDLNNFDERNFEDYYDHFDCIALLDVLEHVLNPKQVLQRLKRFLKEGGFFVISLPNIAFGDIKLQLLTDNFTYTETGILDETHVRFFTFRSIADLLSGLSIQVLDCSTKVADVSSLEYKVPAGVRRYVLNDPHSFVYQYVLKAEATYLERDALEQVNASRMSISWAQVNCHLKIIRRQNLVNAILPSGSARRRLAKQILATFRNRIH